jgi:hypothetical protein
MTNLVVHARTETAWQPTELVSTLLSKGARDVIRHWISHEGFLGEDNEPRMLSLAKAEDKGFEGLVQCVSPHLAPAVIRNELLRKGIVEENGQGCLLLRRSAYIQGTPQTAGRYFADDGRLVVGEAPRRRRNDLI